ncbi:NAD-dependent epimerase/dehydratase family protein [Niallia sp. 01092]|uniref:NAD-dependent epimerase/dehydratase family protein n=1 Tax=unclassified Niallia TaxID=2837522 RepID=UPI003FD281E3
MKVLITGGASSCIGPELIKGLAEKQIEVVVVDEVSSNKVSSLSSIVTYYQTVIDQDSLIKIIMKEQIEYVIHLKTNPLLVNSVKDSFYASEENITATIHVLEACAQTKVKKIIFPSTVAVYGKSDQVLEETALLQPHLFAGLSKKIEEQYIINFHRLYDLSYSILRFSTIYGPLSAYQGEPEIIASAINQYMNKETPSIKWKGEKQTDFIYERDAAMAICASLEGGDNEIINIASGKSSSFCEVAAIIQKESNLIAAPLYQPKNQPTNSQISIKKAQYLLHWQPKMTLEDGIKEMMAHANNT